MVAPEVRSSQGETENGNNQRNIRGGKPSLEVYCATTLEASVHRRNNKTRWATIVSMAASLSDSSYFTGMKVGCKTDGWKLVDAINLIFGSTCATKYPKLHSICDWELSDMCNKNRIPCLTFLISYRSAQRQRTLPGYPDSIIHHTGGRLSEK